MKRDYEQNKIETSGDFYRHQFRVDTNADMFQLIISNLYSRPIEAIVRELSCNAYDAHVAAGNEAIPFDIKLPNHLDHTFHIRDYGTGLVPERIYNLYTVVGLSDKTKSDAFTGAFGVGSKSPFAYTNQFTVESIVDGVKWIYAAYMNSEFIPEIAELSNGGIPTTEKNGLKISFDIKQEDWNNFNQSCRKVFQWFVTKPNISGVDANLVIAPDIEYDLRGDKWGYRKVSSNSYYNYNNRHNSSHGMANRAIMGNVAYEIDVKEIVGYENVLAFDIFFNIGDLTPAANREYLHYDDKTKNNIIKKIEEIKAFLSEKYERKFKNCKSVWEARKLYHESSRTGFVGSIFEQWATNYSFNGKIYRLSESYFKCHDLMLDVVPGYNTWSKNLKFKIGKIENGSYKTINGAYSYNSTIYYDLNVESYHVIADEKYCKLSKAKALSLKHKSAEVYFYDYDNFEKIKKFLLDKGVTEDHILKVSELEKPESNYVAVAAQTTFEKRIKYIKQFNGSGYNLSEIWEDPLKYGTAKDMNFDKFAVYVLRDKYRWDYVSSVGNVDRFKNDINTLKTISSTLRSFKGMPEIEIYSICESQLEIIPANWIPLEKFLEEFYIWLMSGISKDYELVEQFPSISSKFAKTLIEDILQWEVKDINLIEDKEVQDWILKIKEITSTASLYSNLENFKTFYINSFKKQNDGILQTKLYHDYCSFQKQFLSKYPMVGVLKSLDVGYSAKNTFKSCRNTIIDYINQTHKLAKLEAK